MSSDRKMHIITISIHALLAESDLLRVLLICPPRDFYPRSPCGERLVNGDVRSSCFGNFYPRSPCGERLRLYRLSLITLPISIHALLAESDIGYTINFHTKPRFLSTLSLRRATTRTKRIDRNIAFLSTLSLRRATSQQPRGTTRTTYFYPRSPCGERPMMLSMGAILISFLSTLSLRRATGLSYFYIIKITDFYPRSPCGERQISCAWSASKLGDFYPRSPCGERHTDPRKVLYMIYFYPRSPCGERPSWQTCATDQQHFYPRSPCGERPWLFVWIAKRALISIHALLAESD